MKTHLEDRETYQNSRIEIGEARRGNFEAVLFELSETALRSTIQQRTKTNISEAFSSPSMTPLPAEQSEVRERNLTFKVSKP